MRAFPDRLFAVPPTPVTPRMAVTWWEERRLTYNLIVAGAAVIAFFVFFAAILLSGHLAAGEDAVEPLGLMFAAVVFLPVINVCYTLGWMIEAPLRVLAPGVWSRFGPALFGAGLGFSVLLVSAPAILWVAIDIGQLTHLI